MTSGIRPGFRRHQRGRPITFRSSPHDHGLQNNLSTRSLSIVLSEWRPQAWSDNVFGEYLLNYFLIEASQTLSYLNLSLH